MYTDLKHIHTYIRFYEYKTYDILPFFCILGKYYAY